MKLGDRVKITNLGDRSFFACDQDVELILIAGMYNIDGDGALTEVAVVFPESLSSKLIDRCILLPFNKRRVDSWLASDYHRVVQGYERFFELGYCWFGANDVKVTMSSIDGCSCNICGQFSPMSTINNHDGTFTCYSCREYPMRAFY